MVEACSHEKGFQLLKGLSNCGFILSAVPSVPVDLFAVHSVRCEDHSTQAIMR